MAIIDDGVGMNGDEIDTAMRYGGRSPLEDRAKNDLGRFGLGLKTASLSQCDKLTVVSKQGDKLEARCWDMELIRENKTWVVMVLNSRDIKKYLCWRSLKKKALAQWFCGKIWTECSRERILEMYLIPVWM